MKLTYMSQTVTCIAAYPLESLADPWGICSQLSIYNPKEYQGFKELPISNDIDNLYLMFQIRYNAMNKI